MAKAPREKSAAASFDFAAAYKELQGIIEWFEGEEVDLDEGLKKFERGLQLAKQCKSRLQDVENKVSEIREKFDGAGEVAPAAEDEDEEEDRGLAKLL